MSFLEIRDLYKSYGHSSGQVEVLRGLNLSVEKGERLAILGPSGSGKSTFLSLLCGMDRPDRGQITVDGEEISNLDEHGMSLYRSSTIGIVFQQFHLVPHLTALENVMLPLQIAGKQDGGKAMAALDAMALGHRARHLPGELSGGECQRVAMARALISEPKLLLADEPSGNLDSKTGQQVMDVLFERVEALGTTLMLVTHHEPLSQRCQRTLRMEAGLLQGQD